MRRLVAGKPAPAGCAVEITGVSKRYGSGVLAVENLDLRIPRGSVFGFLGRNGAGKTTTMRMLVGLVRPTSGSIRVLGAAPGAPRQLAKVGALIETPTFYPHLSGADNLSLVARYAGIPLDSVPSVLAQVGLGERAGSRYRTYSLGMKQRLGVAAALLKDPQLLILDEPTNGLDPVGVTEMREILRAAGAGGRTVLLSSHVLGEVEQICDTVAVLDKGRLVATGTPAEMDARVGVSGLVISAHPAEQAMALLRELPEVDQVWLADGQLQVATDVGQAAHLNRFLVRAGIDVHELRPIRHSLEEAFLELTGSGAVVDEPHPTPQGVSS